MSSQDKGIVQFKLMSCYALFAAVQGPNRCEPDQTGSGLAQDARHIWHHESCCGRDVKIEYTILSTAMCGNAVGVFPLPGKFVPRPEMLGEHQRGAFLLLYLAYFAPQTL